MTSPVAPTESTTVLLGEAPACAYETTGSTRETQARSLGTIRRRPSAERQANAMRTGAGRLANTWRNRDFS